MRLINKTYRFRIFPNKEQEVLLNKHFGCSRFVYNYFLSERKEQYQKDKKSDNYYAQAKTLTDLKKQEETIWLKEVNSQTLQFALRSLDTAYLNFFRGNAQFPKFKSRKHKNTFTVPQFSKLENGKIILPKFKDGIKVKLHRKVKGKIGKMSITKTPTGKYFVSILTEQEIEQLPKTKKQVGIDLGLKDFVITSDNKKFKNNRYTKKYAKQLKKEQQHLSRKQKGGNGFEKQKLKVAKIHEKIASCRLDTLHKVSKELVESYDLISIEDLNVKGMIKNHKLSKHIADASWGNFVTLLQYKCNWYGKELVKVNRFYPSSKTCGNCGWINQNLKLSDREWTCNSCGVVHDRDVNASINILKEGLKIYGEELAITKVEDKSDYLGSTSVETRSPSHRFSVGG
ncbi:MAG: IS200/IS605 family element RNA-guided endonuclease TnpB [Bacteroidales bacterium]|jgi:putative transposase|nr:IS200/IS605 family element RNA-guided endonuclease TnpB [Bacteroidales bacterium]